MNIRIDEEAGLRALRFEGDGDAIQSLIDPLQPQRLVMENLQYLMSLLLFIPPPQRILLLGVGAGALLHFLRHHYPHSRITGVDNDAALIEHAQQELGLPRADARLDYAITDARDFLADGTDRFDLIVTDIFTGPQSPPWVISGEFIRAVQQRLSPTGAAGWNLLIGGRRSFEHYYRGLRRCFRQQTLCLEHEDHENLLAMGFNFEVKPLPMEQRLRQAAELGARLELPLTDALAAIYRINPVGQGVI